MDVKPPQRVQALLARYKWPLLFSVVAVIYPAICIMFGDIIPVKSGLGYDGDAGVRISQNLNLELLDHKLDAYTFQKSLIWFVLGGIYWAFSQISSSFARELAATDEHLGVNVQVGLISWWVVNSLCLTGTAFLWNSLLKRLAVSGAVELLSFFLLLINVGNLRMPAFYVTMGDTLMTFYGTLLLFLFVTARQWLFVPAGILSGFIRSGLPEATALLALYPCPSPLDPTSSSRTDDRRPDGVVIGPVLVALAVAALVIGYVYHGLVRGDPARWGDPLSSLLSWSAMIVACGYVSIGLYYLLRDVKLKELLPRFGAVLRVLLILAPVALVLKLVATPSIIPTEEFIRSTVVTAMQFPGISLISAVVYFGPGILLAALLWPRVADAAKRFGPGMLAFVSLGLCMSMFSESRVMTVYIPALILLVAIVLSETPGLPAWGFYATSFLCILFAKVWLPMGGGVTEYDDTLMDFPEQLYFMNFGPWMSLESVMLQGGAVLIALAVLACWLYGPRQMPGRWAPFLKRRR